MSTFAVDVRPCQGMNGIVAAVVEEGSGHGEGSGNSEDDSESGDSVEYIGTVYSQLEIQDLLLKKLKNVFGRQISLKEKLQNSQIILSYGNLPIS